MENVPPPAAAAIKPGMIVETTAGDLGQDDLRPPTVVAVVADAAGDVAAVVVKKGLVLREVQFGSSAKLVQRGWFVKWM